MVAEQAGIVGIVIATGFETRRGLSFRQAPKYWRLAQLLPVAYKEILYFVCYCIFFGSIGAAPKSKTIDIIEEAESYDVDL